jgi:hypothetical protein
MMAQERRRTHRDVLRRRQGGRCWMTLTLLVGLLGIVVGGCMTAVSHQPNERLAAELGPPQAHTRLEEVLLRSVNPPINAVEITNDFVRVDLTNTTYQVRVFFKDVQRAELFKNHLVVLWGTGERILFRPVLADAQDAQTFADLMLSWQRR